MSTPTVPREPVELRPVDGPWPLELPRSLDGFRRPSVLEVPIILPQDVPGSTDRRCFLVFCRFVGPAVVAVVYLLDCEPPAYQVVVSRDGDVEAFLFVPCPHGGDDAELHRALHLADRVSEELAADRVVDASAEVWLRAELAWLKEGT